MHKNETQKRKDRKEKKKNNMNAYIQTHPQGMCTLTQARTKQLMV